MNTRYEDGTYLEHNPTWHEQDSSWKANQILKILRKNGVSPSKVCEIGCGAGEILNRLAGEFGDKVSFSGYDISPQAFEIARKKEKKNLHFFLGDPFSEVSTGFDLVLAIDVVEHIEDYFGFLRKLKKTGAYKVLHIPLDMSVQYVLRGSPIMAMRRSVGHVQYFSKDTALATLTDAGYEIVDHAYAAGSIEVHHRGWKVKLMKLPRSLCFSLNPDLAVRILGGYSLLVLAR
jgi:cyclopropane fatty-acyl-phospholipid synthase-like methyltransferase